MKYILFIFVLALIFCLPFFINFDFLINAEGDLNQTHYPVFLFLKKSIFEHHQFPLWRPTIFSGMPFAADPLSVLFYPGTYLFLILPLNFGFTLFYLIHLFIAGLGTYFLARYLDIKENFALFSAVIYMLAPTVFAHIGAGHLILIAGIAYFPSAVLFTLRLFEKKWMENAIWLSIILSLMFLVNFLIFFYSSIAIFFLVVFKIEFSKDYGKFFRFIFPAILFLGFSAAALLPYMEYANLSSRTLLTIDDIAQPPWNLGKFVSSVIFPYAGLTRYNVEAFLYFGFLPSALALFGFLKISRRLKIAVLGTSLLIVLFVLNRSTPFFPFLYRHLPLISYFRVTTRIWFIAVLITAILAGFGLSRLTKNKFIIYLIIFLTLIEFSFVGYKRVNLKDLFKKPSSQIAVYDFFEEDRSTFKIYCTNYCLDQAEAEKRGLRLAMGENPSQLLSYVQYLEKVGGYEFNRHAVIFPPYQVWLDNPNPPQPNPDLLSKLAVKYVVSKYPLTSKDLVKLNQFNDLIVYQNQKFKEFDYLVTPNELVVKLEGKAPSELVMPEIYYPGWIAIVDGKERQLHTRDGVFMAVNLNPDEREVVFKFRPKVFTIGLVITIFTIASVLLFVTRKNYR